MIPGFSIGLLLVGAAWTLLAVAAGLEGRVADLEARAGLAVLFVIASGVWTQPERLVRRLKSARRWVTLARASLEVDGPNTVLLTKARLRSADDALRGVGE